MLQRPATACRDDADELTEAHGGTLMDKRVAGSGARGGAR
jgi:hypothetical protein